MGAICTFFGHRDCPVSVKPKLRAALVDLIEQRGVDRFYVGRQGAFDAIVQTVLREMAETYPNISYAVVLERLSGPRDETALKRSDTIFPEGLEAAPPRFAISQRNEWMLKQADYVIAYIIHGWGGAARFTKRAERQGKTIFNLAQKGPGRDDT